MTAILDTCVNLDNKGPLEGSDTCRHSIVKRDLNEKDIKLFGKIIFPFESN